MACDFTPADHRLEDYYRELAKAMDGPEGLIIASASPRRLPWTRASARRPAATVSPCGAFSTSLPKHDKTNAYYEQHSQSAVSRLPPRSQRRDPRWLQPWRQRPVKVGVGRTAITPKGPIWMSGYAARNHPSEGVIHDLWAKALAIEDSGGGRVVLVTTDLIGLPHELAEEVAARLKAKHGLERSQIVLSSSHTHSGPVVWPGLKSMYLLGPEDRDRLVQYGKKLADDLVRTVAAAMADRAPAQISVGHGSVGFAANRRQPTPKGVCLGVNPNWPVDHDVPVLKVAAPDGKLRAVLFAYACHNTTLGGNLYKINGDYAGFAEIELEKALPATTAMFAILCGGDQNPQPRGKVELAQQHGKTLADEVRRVLGGELRPVRGPVRTAYEVTELEFAPHECATFEREATSTDKYKQARAKLMLAAYDAGRPVRSIPYPVQAVRSAMT